MRDEHVASSSRPGFLWGVATAAYQIEGAVEADGRAESIWDRFSHTPGRVLGGDTGDTACDHYHRYIDDLDLMAQLGIELYRFSIAWPRVQPAGRGRPNRAGVDFYRRLVEGLRERGIEPMVTLYHWDLPQVLQDAGGWANRATADRFAEYAELVFREVDGVRLWITHNEPWVTGILGHALGTKAPGVRAWPTALTACHHVLLSHGLAVQAFRELELDGEIGIALDFSPAYPVGEEEAAREAALRFDGHRNRWFIDPLLRGGYPADMVDWYERYVGSLDFIRRGDLATIAQPIDFLGINYYCGTRVQPDPGAHPLHVSSPPPQLPTTAMGWEVDPGAFHALLLRLHRDYDLPPIYVTENGAAYDDPVPSDGYLDDPERLEYLRSHVAALQRAVAEGVDVRGYCAWSLLDNFEWEFGYSKRFGIVYVDFQTQRRIPKRSALWYRDLIASRALG